MSRILNIKGKHDTERIEKELDHDLVFEQAMRENRGIYEMMTKMEPAEISAESWYENLQSSILIKYRKFMSIPALKEANPDLQLSNVYIYLHELFDVESK